MSSSEKSLPRNMHAHEAVKRARKIVEDNNRMVELLRRDCIHFEKHLSLEEEVRERSEVFERIDKEVTPDMYRIKTSSEIVSFFRDMLGG